MPFLMTGCADSPNYDAAYLRGHSNDALRTVEEAQAREQTHPTEAGLLYREVLAKAKLKNKFAEYQKIFTDDLDAFQRSQGHEGLREDSGLGIAEVYARQIVAATEAYLGLARIALSQKDWAKAESQATEAVAIAKRCEFCPYFMASSHRKANTILETVYKAQGNYGKALIRKLNADLLDDHLKSDGGIEDFYLEKQVTLGEHSQRQMAAVEELFVSVRTYRRQQEEAMTMAVAGGLMAASAGIQQGLAQHALAESGGVMTPQVQQAQMNAQMAQMQSQLFMTMVATQAGAGPKALQVNATPWSIPTFTQQLVDPKQGTNTPTIMKGFATSAAKAGGGSYQAGAQQVNEQVDALMPYRQSGKVDGAAAQVEKFAEVLNAFLTQVQEIKK
ncbi:MAG: hypothetical protein JSR29_07670 [Nitrospira sp.]|nr:hypothetical protein [Nitrospira sp.]